MEKRNVLDKRHVRLEEVMKEGYIPLFGGRPVRETAIDHEDLINLKINLNVVTTVEEFLKLI